METYVAEASVCVLYCMGFFVSSITSKLCFLGDGLCLLTSMDYLTWQQGGKLMSAIKLDDRSEEDCFLLITVNQAVFFVSKIKTTQQTHQ